MFQRLVSHNDDIRRLVEKGYAVAFDSAYLVVRDVPYLAANRSLRHGALVSPMYFIDNDRVRQTDHQVWFAGSVPYALDGTPIPNLGVGPATLALSEATKDVVVERSFSTKPLQTGAFGDFFDKPEHTVGIIPGHAQPKYPEATPLTFPGVD